MADTNPNLTENAWVKVATNKTYGQIVVLEGKTDDFKFWKKGVATGGAAPTLAAKLLSPRAFKDSNMIEMNSSVALDYYIYTIRRVKDPTLSVTIEGAIMVTS